jgi:hypothetical protein
MAIEPCKDCGEPMSSRGDECRSCGRMTGLGRLDYFSGTYFLLMILFLYFGML